MSDARAVSFFSDFGAGSERVGVCRAVMASLAPSVRVVDVTHDLPAFDIRAASLTLVRCAQYLPEGVVLAVVDPGSGSTRRCVAVEVEGGAFVGPDNGILAAAVAMVGGPTRVVELTNPDTQLEAPAPTFAARDVLAPAAALLADGTDIAELGEDVDPVTMVPGLLPIPDLNDDGSVVGEVIGIDRFGNCQLNVDPDQIGTGVSLAAPNVAISVQVGDAIRRARVVRSYSEAQPSELVALIDASGLMTLACDRASAARELDARLGTKVTVLGAGVTAPSSGGEIPVRLTIAPSNPPSKGT